MLANNLRSSGMGTGQAATDVTVMEWVRRSGRAAEDLALSCGKEARGSLEPGHGYAWGLYWSRGMRPGEGRELAVGQ